MKLRTTVILLMAAALLFGQGERATFDGTITDPSGSSVPGATVKATNVATNVEIQATTNASGIYRLPYMPSGTYKISVTAPGFKSARRN